jgi:hypothetical protein
MPAWSPINALVFLIVFIILVVVLLRVLGIALH